MSFRSQPVGYPAMNLLVMPPLNLTHTTFALLMRGALVDY